MRRRNRRTESDSPGTTPARRTRASSCHPLGARALPRARSASRPCARAAGASRGAARPPPRAAPGSHPLFSISSSARSRSPRLNGSRRERHGDAEVARFGRKHRRIHLPAQHGVAPVPRDRRTKPLLDIRVARRSPDSAPRAPAACRPAARAASPGRATAQRAHAFLQLPDQLVVHRDPDGRPRSAARRPSGTKGSIRSRPRHRGSAPTPGTGAGTRWTLLPACDTTALRTRPATAPICIATLRRRRRPARGPTRPNPQSCAPP